MFVLSLVLLILATFTWLAGTSIILRDLKHFEDEGQTITTAVERIYAITWPIWIFAMFAIGVVSVFFVLVDLLIKRIFFNENVHRQDPASVAK